MRMTTCLTKGVKQNSQLQRRESYLLNAALNHNIYPIVYNTAAKLDTRILLK